MDPAAAHGPAPRRVAQDEDHVGALPYLLREVRVPEIWATALTLGLVKSKLDEHGLMNATELRENLAATAGLMPDPPMRKRMAAHVQDL